MQDNLEKALVRGDKIEVLVEKTSELRKNADAFRITGTQLRRKFWLDNVKMKIAVSAIIIAVLLAIFFAICTNRCF